MSDIWIDGYCHSCGSPVFETGSDRDDEDYRNTCTNTSCLNFGWHHQGDMDILDYYSGGTFKIHDQSGDINE